MHYLIGNWKSNETITEARIWLDQFKNRCPSSQNSLETVLCMPFTTLAPANRYIYDYRLPLKTGAQDVSVYAEGAHTGSITAKMLSELINYCLVGHSERRREVGDDCQTVALKTRALLEHSITPIVCLDTPYLEEQIKALFNLRLPINRCLFAYEPIAAIGIGLAADPAHIEMVATRIAFLSDSSCPILYGGSVDPNNIRLVLDLPNVSGVLVGSGSLNPENFARLLQIFNETLSV